MSADLAALILDRATNKDPEAVAIVSEEGELTYRQFAESACRLAHHLRSIGVRTETIVAVVMDRSPEQLIAAFAVLLAGGAYLPLDPSQPTARLAGMLEDARAAVIVTRSEMLGAVPGDVPLTVLTDVHAERIASMPSTPPDTSTGPDHLAYVVFTSGSTGRPKGAMNDRGALLSHLLWMQRTYRLTPDDTVLHKTSVGWDVSLLEFFWPLLAGARVVVAKPDGHRDPQYMAEIIGRHGVNFAHFVPSMLRVFLDTADLSRCGSLRQVIVSGEVLTADLQRRFFEGLPHAELDNVYGPVEAAIHATRWRCRRDGDGAAIPIGAPIDGVEIRVLDGIGQPVADGAEGDLYIGGIQVGRGYIGRPALTAERFVPDPSGPAGTRLYRTGDRGRRRSDGALEFLGRVDDQVKLRGVRVELGEIEAVLSGQPGVRACAVAVRGAGDEASLIAYVVGTAETARLREALGELLPAGMVPNRYIWLDELPLLVNGKLDRRRLADLEGDSVPDGSPEASTMAEASPLERELATLWSGLLGVQVPDPNADLQELGASSLHGARMLARVRNEYDPGLTLREVISCRTVAELAALLERRGVVGAEQGLEPPLPPVPAAAQGAERATDPVISLSQQRLWFLDHLSAMAGIAYNVPAALRLRGPLDSDALRGALHDVVHRHEQLRCSFPLGEHGPTVRVQDSPRPHLLETVDVSDHPDPAGEALTRATSLTSEHFDLEQGPLLRCTLYRLGANDHLMVAVFHHIVSDGLTVDIFDRDLAIAYRSRVVGASPDWPELSLGYRDFAHWQRALAEGAAIEPPLKRWRGQLADAPVVLELPADRPRPPVRTHRGRRVQLPARGGTLASVRRLAAATRTTPYAICLAAFGCLLRETTGGGQDFVVASPAAGRPDPGLEDTVGFFANTVPVRLKPVDTTFARLVTVVHEAALESLDGQYVPFERLTAEFAPERDLSRPPLAQVAFAYQGPQRPNAGLADVESEVVELDTGTAKFDLSIELAEVPNGQGEPELEATVEFSTDLYTLRRAERILERFLGLLAAAIESPDTNVAELTADKFEEQAPALPGAASSATSTKCLHETYAETAAKWPDRTALTDGRRSLTYAELDQAANRLAHRLIRAGAGPEELVGLCAERSVDLVVGVLGILKAGAGYLSLDPSHPAERRRETLTDARCRILLGDQRSCRPLALEGVSLVPLESDEAATAGLDMPSEAPDVAVDPENVAYVIYTSGSTGRPKGVAVTHANAARLMTVTSDEFEFGPHDVWTLFHSIAFDFSVWEIWGPLLHGGRLVVVPYVTSRDPSGVLELLRHEHVTVLNQTPTAFRQLAAAAQEAGYPPLDLRLVVFGGEALDPMSLREWVGGYGTARPRLVNMYGITETTVHVTSRQITIADLSGSPSPIGAPLGDLRVRILGEALEELPQGVEGEMYVGGPGVSRGYLFRPSLTAERFVPDRFGPAGARLYRTGDLAVRTADGGLVFRGRTDSQIQLRGFRIELGEIERTLLDEPGVRSAACGVREDLPGDPRIVAYLVVQPGHTLETTALRDALVERLPAYMVPAAYVVLPALPLNANGKLDRVALAAFPLDADALLGRAGQGRAPDSPTERALAGVWSQVLGVEVADVESNFFALGGDSIIAIRLGAACRAADLPVTIERIFLHPTVAELAAECDSVMQTSADSRWSMSSTGELTPPAPSVSLADLDPRAIPADVVDAYPVAAMQLAILYECELVQGTEDSVVYHDLASVRVTAPAPFDRDALEEACGALCERHEILRTSFDIGSLSEPMQLVHRAARIPVTVETVRGIAPEDALQAWWLRERMDPFDTARAPLVRCHVQIDTDDTSFQLSLAVHHIMLDGWSLARLMTEMLLEYDARLQTKRTADIPTPATRYRDFIAAEQATAADQEAERFWWEHGVARAPHPLPVLPPFGDHSEGQVYEFDVPVDLDAQLRRHADRLGIPLKSVYLAAHLWALGELTGESEVVTGLQTNGRPEHDGADLVLGLMLNLVPLRIAHHTGSWAELAEAAFSAERELQPYRRYPAARMQQAAGFGRPLFEAAFNYTDFHAFESLAQAALVRTGEWRFADRHSLPLLAEVERSPLTRQRAVKVSVGVGSKLAGTGRRLGEHITRALAEIAADPTRPAR